MEAYKKPVKAADKKPERRLAIKVHRTEKGHVVGACDRHLVGKKLKEGKLVLELSEEFYFERHATPEELAGLLEGCMTANLVGEEAVAAYCKINPEAKHAIRRVGGVPHLQIFQL